MSDLDKLGKALADAMKEMGSAKKGSKNPFFKSSYADLAEIIKVSKPVLAKHGLTIIQGHTKYISGDGDKRFHYVHTTIIHSSGQTFDCGEVPVLATKADAQGFGAGETYAKRYAWQAAIGLPTEDDDGNYASGRSQFANSKPSMKL